MGKKYQVSVEIGAKDKFSQVLGKLGKGVSKFGRAVGDELKNTGKQILWAGAALVGLGYGAKKAGEFLFGFAKDAADTGSQINDLSQQTGIGAAKIQEYGYAFKKGGVSAEDFASALSAMTKNVGQLQAGKGKLKGFLDTVAGPGFISSLKKAKPEERLSLLVGAMMAITDESKRAAFAQAAFGDAGAKLAGVAGQGADSFAAAVKNARELGLVMSDEDVAAADEFGDRLEDLEDGWGAIKRKFGMALAEGLLPMLKDGVAWLKTNRREVSAWASELGTSVATGVKAVAEGFRWIYDHRGELLDWAKALAITIGAIKIGSIFGSLLGGGGGGAAGGILGTLGKAAGGALGVGAGVGTFAATGVLAGVAGLGYATYKYANATPGEKAAGWANIGAMKNPYTGVSQDDANKGRNPAYWAGRSGQIAGGYGQLVAERAAIARVQDFKPARAAWDAMHQGTSPLVQQPSQMEVFLRVEDRLGLLGAPRVDASPGVVVKTKKLNTGKAGSSKP